MIIQTFENSKISKHMEILHNKHVHWICCGFYEITNYTD